MVEGEAEIDQPALGYELRHAKREHKGDRHVGEDQALVWNP